MTRSDNLTAAQAAVPELAARISACLAGSPTRRVRDSIARARNAQEPEYVGANVVEAEIAAGLRSVEDWPVRFDAAVWARVPA